MNKLLKTTIVGGVLFLLPVVLVLVILGYAVRLAADVVQPISKSLPFDLTVAGVGAVTILAVLLLVMISFVAGMFSRTEAGRRFSGWLEGTLLDGVPQYQLVKSIGEGLARIEGANNLKPALIGIDGGWQIGYVLEPIGDRWMAVFLPLAPTATAGNVMYLPSDRIRPLDISMAQAKSLITHMGIGSGEVLRGTDLMSRGSQVR